MAKDLKNDYKLFNDESDDDKDVNDDMAQVLFNSVKNVIKKNPELYKVSIISISCDNDDR